MNKNKSPFNGVAMYLANKHDIPRERENIQSHEDVNNVMVQYLESTGQSTGSVIENAECIQKDFKKFRSWSRKNLEK